MKKSFCEVLLQYYPRISEFEDLHSTFITNFVFNSFLCYTAIMLNIVTIVAVRKTSSLPRTLKTLLLSLVVSDVGVGLLVHPFYISLLAKWIEQSIPGCSAQKIFLNLTYFLATASFFGVLAVSVDRFLAIHLHLRYQELVTHKRVVAVVISIWVLSAFLGLMPFWVPLDIRTLILSIIIVTGLALTTLVYIRIYFAVRRHKNQIQTMQVQQEAPTCEIVKSVVGIFYVYLVFLACYFPYFICMATIKVYGPSVALKKFNICASTLLYVNSSLNPVIYCWKMRQIRHAIMDILRNMSWFRKSESHQQQGLLLLQD